VANLTSLSVFHPISQRTCGGSTSDTVSNPGARVSKGSCPAWYVLLAAFLMNTSAASAQSRVQRDRRADPIVLVDLGWQPPGEELNTETRSQSPTTTDPVLRYWSPEEGELAWDDDSGVSMNASIRYRTTGWEHVIIMMHAAHAWSRGSAHFVFNGIDYGALPVAGRFISVPCGTTNDVHAVAQPFGPSSLQLYAFDRTRGHLTDFDSMGGVGGDALVAGRADVCTVMLGRRYFATAPTGTVSIYVNDVGRGHDADGDGLGAELETALGTCDSSCTPGLCDSTCPGVLDPADTDHDGLPDGDELLGYEWNGIPHEPQNLAAWGASPLHKDVFVEVDWAGDSTAAPIIRPASILRTVSYYTSSTASPGLVGASTAEARNPDGRAGIALHFDIGQPTPVDRLDMPYGAWSGGGQRVSPDTEYRPSYADDMRPIRRLAFRHAVAYPDGTGQAPVGGVAISYNAATSDAGATLAHETGHSLGLSHYGIRAWGPLNCKPTYQSIMNYAYGSFGFSHANQSPVRLDPSDAFELQGLYPVNSSLMLASPWRFDVSWFGGVDWNRDGTFEHGRIKASIADNIFYNDCGTFANAEKRQTVLRLPDKSAPSPAASFEPGLVQMDGRLYAMWLGRTDGRLHYRSAPLGHPEWDDCDASANGTRGDSLSLVGERHTPECNHWSPERTLTLADATHLSAVSWGHRTYLAWSNARNTVYHVRALRENSTSWGYSQPGVLAFTGTTYSSAAGHYTWPTVAVMHVDPSRHHGHDEVLGVFYENWLQQYGGWISSEDGLSWHNEGLVVDEDGSPIQHSLPPAFASVPGGATCAVFPINGVSLWRNPHLEFYCFDARIERFIAGHPLHPEGGRNSPLGPNPIWTSTARPSLAFHVFRNSQGLPVHDDASDGQFVLSYVATNGSDAETNPALGPRLFFSRHLSASSDPLTDVVFPSNQHHYMVNSWARTMGRTGVTLLEGASLHSLKGVWLNGNAGEDDWKGIDFFPSVDATYQVELGTGNDFVAIESRMCSGIASARSHFAQLDNATSAPSDRLVCARESQ